MNSRTFLDIDDTILTKNLILPGNGPKDDDFMKQLDTKPFHIIQPMPGICVKAKTDAGEKIFLNICTSEKIPPPDDISDAKFSEILAEENSQFVIPMSIGNERLEPDKGGSPCVTYDIAINKTYFERCEKNKNFLMFTIWVIMDGVSDKFNKVLKDYVILKNRKVMGKLQQHRIENREPRIPPQSQKPLIEEIKGPSGISNEKQNEKSLLENVSSGAAVKRTLNYVLLKQPLEGSATNLIGLFDMPKGVSSKEIDVLLNEDRIVITVEQTGLTYDLSVPCIIDVIHAKCSLDKYLRVLRVDMPIENNLATTKTF